MQVETIEISDTAVTVVDVDGNEYSVFFESEIEEERNVALTILDLANAIMETIPPNGDEINDLGVGFVDADDDY